MFDFLKPDIISKTDRLIAELAAREGSVRKDMEHYVSHREGGTAILFHRCRKVREGKKVEGYDYFCPACGHRLETDHGCMGDTVVCKACRVDYGYVPGITDH